MTMRTWILIAAMALAPLGMTGTALAQGTAPHHGGPRMHAGPHGRGGPGMHRRGPGERVRMLVAILGLDATQEATVRQIFEANRPRFQEIRGMTDPAARRTAMQTLHQQTRTQIDAVLTPEQRATLDRMEAARRERGPGAEHHAPSGI